MKCSSALAALMLALAPLGAQCPPLTTPYASNLGQAGNMFDVQNHSALPVTIHGLDLNLDAGTWNLEVYALTGTGSWSGNENTPSAWGLAASANSVVSLGVDQPTPFPGQLSINVPAGAVRGLYVTVTNGFGMRYTIGSSTGTVLASDGSVSILSGSGNTYPFGAAFTPRDWNGTLHYSMTGSPQFEVNSAEASLDLNGLQGSSCAPVRLTFCGGTSITVNVQSTLVGNPFEIILGLAPLVPIYQGGTYAATQVVNLDLSQQLLFFNGVSLPAYQPFPGNISATATPPAPLTLSAQGLWLDGAAPEGFHLSQAVQVDSVPPSGVTSIAGPTANDDSVSLNVVGLPHCWADRIPAFGNDYSSISVEANGRLMFGSGDSDFSPTLSEALNDAPFIGFWTDLDPSQGGTITASTPNLGSKIIRVDFVNVPYFGVVSPTVSFGVEIDCTTGILSFDGLQGIGVNPSGGSTGDNQFLGLSPGNGAQDPGTQAFLVGGSATAANAGDMLYDFAVGVGTAGPTVLNALLPGTLDRLVFTPDGSGNYSWQAF